MNLYIKSKILINEIKEISNEIYNKTNKSVSFAKIYCIVLLWIYNLTI